MDWINRMTKISNKVKFQLFGRNVDNLEKCYEAASKIDQHQSGRMTDTEFSRFLNSFGIFLTTQELRVISDHYNEIEVGRVNFVDFVEFVRKDISAKRTATI